MTRLRDESGQLMPMIIGFVVIALLMITVMANASKAFLYRRSLASWADGAVTLAAQSVAEQQVYTGHLGEVLPISESDAAVAVADYAARAGLPDRFDGFTIEYVTVDQTAGTVSVGFAAVMPLAWANQVTSAFTGGVRITAEATAVAPLE